MHHPYQSTQWYSAKALQGWTTLKGSDTPPFVLIKEVPVLGRLAVTQFYPTVVEQSGEELGYAIQRLAELAAELRVQVLLFNPYVISTETGAKVRVAMEAWHQVGQYALVSFKGRMVYNMTYLVGMQGSENEVMAAFSSNYRNEIRAARRRGALVEINRHARLRDFYELYSQIVQRGGQSRLSWNFVKQLYQTQAQEMGLPTLVEVRGVGGETTNYVFLLCGAGVALYLLAAHRPGPLPGAGKLAVLEAMNHLRNFGFKYLDLGGVIIPPPNKKIGTINDFKRRFGGSLVQLPGAYALVKPRSIRGQVLVRLWEAHLRGWF